MRKNPRINTLSGHQRSARRRKRITSTESGQLVVSHPVNMDTSYGAAESQRRDHGTDGLGDRVDTGVLDTPGPV